MLAYFTRVRVADATARRTTEAAGAAYVAVQTVQAEALAREAPTAPPGPALQSLSADGAIASLVGQVWAEVKTLAVGAVGEPVWERGEPVVHTSELSYFSRLTDAATFTRLATVETHRRGTATAGQVAAVMDGAEWEQGVIDEHRPDAVRILTSRTRSGTWPRPRPVAPPSPGTVRVPPERWPLIAADARALGLRGAARRHGISHETVRQIARRLEADAPSAAATRGRPDRIGE